VIPQADNPDILASRGGLRIGSSFWLAGNYTVPLVELRIAADGLWLNYVCTEVTVPRESIRRNYCQKKLLDPGIRIVHNDEKIPPFILFWAYRMEEEMNALGRKKYPIE
jgi:hypothetical protein